MCFALSPVFAIENIQVTELHCYTADQICQKIGLSAGQNLFAFNKGKARKTLEADPYIADARLLVHLPRTIEVQITERRICGYVPYLGTYLYIDAQGQVLDAKDSYEEAHPLVQGLQFSSFQKGQVLPADNADALAVVVQMSKIIQKHEMDQLVLEVDVSDIKNLVIRVENVTVKLGDSQDLEDKLRTLYQVVQNLPKGDRGTLDLSDLSKPIVFQYLT